MSLKRTSPLVVVGVVAALAGITQLGPRLAPQQTLFGLPKGTPLNYSSDPLALPPLTQDFIERVLGRRSSTGVDQIRTAVQRERPLPSRSEPKPTLRAVIEHPLTNDNFERAFAVRSVPFTGRTSTRSAGRQSNEPTTECSSSGRTIWYRYTPDRDVGLLANTFGTTRPTSVGVFTGTSLESLRLVNCDSNARGNSHVALAATFGTTYFFQITDPLGGSLVFNLDLLGPTELASIGSQGQAGNDVSGWPKLSEDGRYVAFHSWSSTLMGGDDNECSDHALAALVSQSCLDVFVRDRVAGKTERISVSSSGEQGNEASAGPSISSDGRHVAFVSWASNLVDGPADTNGWPDVFVRDRVLGTTTRVSVGSHGAQGKAPLPIPAPPGLLNWQGPHSLVFDEALYSLDNGAAISGDGRHVAFSSSLNGLVPEDRNHQFDVFVHDRITGITSRVSVSSDGKASNGKSIIPSISADGRVVSFSSDASNLAGSPRPDCVLARCVNVFVHDRATRETRLISASPSGEMGNAMSSESLVSGNGRYVVFSSTATNLVGPDQPGTEDVFLHDLMTGRTTRVTPSTPGRIVIKEPEPYLIVASKEPVLNAPSISADGRFIAFSSIANFVVEDFGDTTRDVFVYDRVTGVTIRVSVSSTGDAADDASFNQNLSPDGTVVAFSSGASNLDPNDRGGTCLDTNLHASCVDVFVHELPPVP